MAIRITCINKAAGNHEDPHVAISMFGWENEVNRQTGKSTRIEMHNWVKHGGHAYVRDTHGHTAFLIAKVSLWGNPFVQTIADGRLTDNLLRLLECR